MRKLLVMICVCLMSSLTSGQTSAGQGKDDKVKEELRKLHSDYQEAGSKRDRVALERLFADEYVWFQANGNVNDKTKHSRIRKVMLDLIAWIWLFWISNYYL